MALRPCGIIRVRRELPVYCPANYSDKIPGGDRFMAFPKIQKPDQYVVEEEIGGVSEGEMNVAKTCGRRAVRQTHKEQLGKGRLNRPCWKPRQIREKGPYPVRVAEPISRSFNAGDSTTSYLTCCTRKGNQGD